MWVHHTKSLCSGEDYHGPQGFPGSSVGKESAYIAGDPSSIPGSGRSAGEVDRLPTPVFLDFPYGSAGKESAHNAGDLGWEDPQGSERRPIPVFWL